MNETLKTINNRVSLRYYDKKKISTEHMDKIIEYWHLIKSPKYYKTKSLQENLQAMYDDLQYWPKPMLTNKVVKALHLEYENEDR